ncbi:MAG TPA: zinc finger domain-containing protein [Ktedonobacteraceae bacterium]|nr:zinc finger domain-containing protein [Ktedonobacteraceae bacterium]
MTTAVCERCDGTGVLTISSTCRKCSGTGEVIIYENDGSESIETCPNCDFGLVFIEQICPSCNGTGQIDG